MLGLVCPQCGKGFRVKKASAAAKRKFCSHRCAFAANGAKVRAAASAPVAVAKRADKRRGSGAGNGYIKRNGRHEHRVLAEREAGRPLARGEVVHHKDLNHRNNDPANLEILPSQAEHARLHFTGVKRPPQAECHHGHPLAGANLYVNKAGRRVCLTCRRKYDREWKQARRETRQGDAR